MKQYWQNLSAQEQRTVKWGAIFLGVFVFIRLLWWPLYSRIDTLKADIINERELVEWMQPTVELLKRSGKKSPAAMRAPRLTTIEKSFASSGLTPFVKHLSQNENKEIVVHLQDVPFAPLVESLEALDQQSGIEPLSFSATKKKMGIVDADIVF